MYAHRGQKVIHTFTLQNIKALCSYMLSSECATDLSCCAAGALRLCLSLPS